MFAERRKLMKKYIDKALVTKFLIVCIAYLIAMYLFSFLNLSFTVENMLIYGVLMSGCFCGINKAVRIKDQYCFSASWTSGVLRRAVMTSVAILLSYFSCRYVQIEAIHCALILMFFLTFCYYILLNKIQWVNNGRHLTFSLLLSLILILGL